MTQACKPRIWDHKPHNCDDLFVFKITNSAEELLCCWDQVSDFRAKFWFKKTIKKCSLVWPWEGLLKDIIITCVVISEVAELYSQNCTKRSSLRRQFTKVTQLYRFLQVKMPITYFDKYFGLVTKSSNCLNI